MKNERQQTKKGRKEGGSEREPLLFG
jgi:hypothetical protein